jgi:hypothetical protein
VQLKVGEFQRHHNQSGPVQIRYYFPGIPSKDAQSEKKNAPSYLTSFTCHHRASSSAYPAPLIASTLQLPPSPTRLPGPCLATRDNVNTSTYTGQLSTPHTYQDVSTGSSESANSRDTTPIRPAANQVLFLQNTTTLELKLDKSYLPTPTFCVMCRKEPHPRRGHCTLLTIAVPATSFAIISNTGTRRTCKLTCCFHGLRDK